MRRTTRPADDTQTTSFIQWGCFLTFRGVDTRTVPVACLGRACGGGDEQNRLCVQLTVSKNGAANLQLLIQAMAEINDAFARTSSIRSGSNHTAPPRWPHPETLRHQTPHRLDSAAAPTQGQTPHSKKKTRDPLPSTKKTRRKFIFVCTVAWPRAAPANVCAVTPHLALSTMCCMPCVACHVLCHSSPLGGSQPARVARRIGFRQRA